MNTIFAREKRREMLFRILLILLGAAILSFGMHNIHRRTDVTEGGVLGLMLLVDHWLHISPSISGPVMDAICYALALRFLGMGFIGWSALATGAVAAFFRLWESLPYMLPDLSGQPLLAAICGAVFVGVGVGLIVRQGGSAGGDDALALTISHVTGWRLSRAYLITDFIVLALSLTYIAPLRIAYSVASVTLSGLLVDFVKSVGKKS